MLYKLNKEANSIEMMPFVDFEYLSKKEKDLENLLAENLSNLYIEDGQLMTIFQERAMQEEPDLCALDKDGNLVIFELKRGEVQGNTTIQILRYAQLWGQKSYQDLADGYDNYCVKNNLKMKRLKLAHKEAFGLDLPLEPHQFNREQKLIIVGSSSDNELIKAVDYWKAQGVSIDFIPYRIYEMGNDYYFEFFSKPYDTHVNPRDRKGIIFDTNYAYDRDAIWDMLGNHKVSSYGSVADAVNSFKKGDYVLYYHKGYGIVAAGKIKSTAKVNKQNTETEKYCDVELLTPEISKDGDIKYIKYSELCELLDKNFYLARTAKVPYLSEEESQKVVKCLIDKYNAKVLSKPFILENIEIKKNNEPG